MNFSSQPIAHITRENSVIEFHCESITSSKKPTPKKLTKLELEEMKELRLAMLRYQQAAYIIGKRIVTIFEGFDVAGKGSSIRHLTEALDPRSSYVILIGAPTAEEKGQHYLQRFWHELPNKGHLTVFDRSWYGREVSASN